MPLSAAASWRGRPSRTSAIASIRRTCAPSEHFAAKLRSSALVCSVRLIFNVTPIRSLHRANRRTRTSNRKSLAVGIPPLESRPTRAGIIPAALKIDPCPGATGDGIDALRIPMEELPGLLAGGDDGFVAVPDEPAELVAAQIVPDVLHR